ncbi:hypothetical protein Q5P01_003371 [Channa striata]|uniref:Uncharacterized protein n=1 Tax=Channa striata TaxID=64152 RepID=A0AA88T4Q1_CHASR|nr:hypothetical protein Q5P01_003371 [Channa striata]
MGLLQNQNTTWGFSQLEVTYWESTPSSAVYNAIIVLSVLTFALQLCLVLYFMQRCWRLDNRVKQAFKHPDTVNKVTAPSSFQLDIKNQLVDVAAVSSSYTVEDYEPTSNSLLVPFIPWDLVQR